MCASMYGCFQGMLQVQILDYNDSAALASVEELFAGERNQFKVVCPIKLTKRLIPSSLSQTVWPERVIPMKHVTKGPITSAVWRPWTTIPYTFIANHNLHLCIRIVTLKGTVVRGFNRGSAQLGVPTANIDYDFCFGNDKGCFPLPGIIQFNHAPELKTGHVP